MVLDLADGDGDGLVTRPELQQLHLTAEEFALVRVCERVCVVCAIGIGMPSLQHSLNHVAP